MMRTGANDNLLDTALTGASRTTLSPLRTGTSLDEIFEKSPVAEQERALLLMAGARAVYRQAGVRPRAILTAQPAPPETAATCSPRARDLLDHLLSQNRDSLLLEALKRLHAADMRLPFNVLPHMLALRGAALRDVLLPVLGQRGIWLAAHNPEWQWVRDRISPDIHASFEVHQAAWEDGTSPQRLAALRQVRARTPEQARAWVIAAWGAEKADVRREMLGALSDGLSQEDESLLENALDCRSSNVRACAANLLMRLPDSALSLRMRERANAVLRYEPKNEPLRGLRKLTGALGRGGNRGVLRVMPPETLPKDWTRDGIAAKPPQGIGARAWWTQQLLSAVPLRHLPDALGTDPSELVHMAAGNADWGAVVLEGWTHALSPDASDAWFAALWESCRRRHDEAKISEDCGPAWRMLEAMLTLLPAAHLEPVLRAELVAAQRKPVVHRTGATSEIRTDFMSRICARGLDLTAKPWSASLGETYLQSLRTYLVRARDVPSLSPGSWMGTLPVAAEALPPACFDQALTPWTLPETDDWLWRRWGTAVEQFQDTIRLRKLIAEEIRA